MTTDAKPTKQDIIALETATFAREHAAVCRDGHAGFRCRVSGIPGNCLWRHKAGAC
jgi:hypothetical protein